MKICFDERKWLEAVKSPDWYLSIYPEYENLVKSIDDLGQRKYKACKRQIYDFFELRLKSQTIALADYGPDWDQERAATKKIIIHHTSQPSGISTLRVSAIQLINIYARNYYFDQVSKGAGIFSNHFRNGRQVFYVYHWLVRSDGDAERLLDDNQIGWQSGMWDTNKESVAICLDGDFENSSPNEKMIKVAGTRYTLHIVSNFGTIAMEATQCLKQSQKRSGTRFCPGLKTTVSPLTRQPTMPVSVLKPSMAG